MRATATRVRSGAIDTVRGVAVLLMVVDHWLLFTDPGNVVRYTVTRWSLPLFALATARGFRVPFSRRRVVRLALAIGAETALYMYSGVALPGPVALLTLALLAVNWRPEFVREWWPFVVVGGLLQAQYQPVAWSGYQPGLVLAYVVVFSMFLRGGERTRAVDLLQERCAWRWVRAIGERPLLWYFGHLGVLVLVFGRVR